MVCYHFRNMYHILKSSEPQVVTHHKLHLYSNLFNKEHLINLLNSDFSYYEMFVDMTIYGNNCTLFCIAFCMFFYPYYAFYPYQNWWFRICISFILNMIIIRICTTKNFFYLCSTFDHSYVIYKSKIIRLSVRLSAICSPFQGIHPLLISLICFIFVLKKNINF